MTIMVIMRTTRRCLVRFIEISTIELRSLVVADPGKEEIAFANTKGDIIYIGVNDN